MKSWVDMVSDSDRHSAGTGVRATRQRGAIMALLDSVDEFRSAQELHDDVAAAHGFSDVSHTIELFGTCSECRS